MMVTLLFFDGCPNWQTTNDNLEALAVELGFDFDRCHVETDEDAQRLQFRGSPTVLIDGRDVFAAGDEPIGLSCRMYQTGHGHAGSPSAEQLRRVVTAAITGRLT
ncbi:MAG: thioredoxin family protein [Ilumatobacteraceae bacterium]|nr:thioredoxin family protein [Ilumatobacteraceae bacterium]